jgi:DNA-binding transcriptional LysR family regulator
VLRYPLVMGDPQFCEGYCQQIKRILRVADQEPLVAEQAMSCELMMAMVAAGLALGLAGASQIAGGREQGIVSRPLAGRPPMLTTYLLRLDREPSERLSRFVERVVAAPSCVTSSGR